MLEVNVFFLIAIGIVSTIVLLNVVGNAQETEKSPYGKKAYHLKSLHTETSDKQIVTVDVDMDASIGRNHYDLANMTKTERMAKLRMIATNALGKYTSTHNLEYLLSNWKTIEIKLENKITSQMYEDGLYIYRLRVKNLEPYLTDLVGKHGHVIDPLKPSGTVSIRGEIWSANSDYDIPSNLPVVVTRQNGLQLVVEPLPQSANRKRKLSS